MQRVQDEFRKFLSRGVTPTQIVDRGGPTLTRYLRRYLGFQPVSRKSGLLGLS